MTDQPKIAPCTHNYGALRAGCMPWCQGTEAMNKKIAKTNEDIARRVYTELLHGSKFDLPSGIAPILEALDAKDAKIAELNRQLEAMNSLVRANSSLGQGDIDGFVADYPEIEDLKEKIAALEADITLVSRERDVEIKRARNAEAENAAWKSRFQALVGHDSPDSAGNAVITLQSENAALKEELRIEYLNYKKVRTSEPLSLVRTYCGKPMDYWFGLEDTIKTLREEVEKSKKCDWCGSNDLVCGKAWKDERTTLKAEIDTANREIGCLQDVELKWEREIERLLKALDEAYKLPFAETKAVQKELLAASIQIGELREALEPFAKMYDTIRHYAPDAACKKAKENLSRTPTHYALKSEAYRAMREGIVKFGRHTIHCSLEAKQRPCSCGLSDLIAMSERAEGNNNG